MSAVPTLNGKAIGALCRAHGVSRLVIFGSAVRGDWDAATSDLDFLVEFCPSTPSLFDAYFNLKDGLEQLLGSPVDLAMACALENPFFAQSVAESSRVMYAA